MPDMEKVKTLTSILEERSGALHRCNRCSAAFSLRPYLVSFRGNLPVRAGDSPSALAVRKELMPMIF